MIVNMLLLKISIRRAYILDKFYISVYIRHQNANICENDMSFGEF